MSIGAVEIRNGNITLNIEKGLPIKTEAPANAMASRHPGPKMPGGIHADMTAVVRVGKAKTWQNGIPTGEKSTTRETGPETRGAIL